MRQLMGVPTVFRGANFVLKAPIGSENFMPLPVFRNGVCCVSAWELSDKELVEVVRTRRVFVAVMYGMSQPPVFVGSESDVREVVADYGVWKR